MGKAMLAATFGTGVGRVLPPAEIRQIAIFQGVDQRQLEKFPGTVVRREFQPGQVICREGEGGTTAFYILEGDAKVFIGKRTQAATAQRGGFLAAIGSIFGQRQVKRKKRHANHLVPIDASVDLSYGELATKLTAGDVFGEMSCLNLAPRSATVVADTHCVMLEILRNMYELLQRSPAFKQKMDDNYRARALAGHLRNTQLFEGLEPADIDDLRKHADLVTVEAGHVVFHEGDSADDTTTGGVYLVRLGQVKVSHRAPGGERTLAYLTRGDVFGETGALRKATRNATVTAIDHPIVEEGRKRKPARVELVRIRPEQFDTLVTKYPKIRGRLEALGMERLRSQIKTAATVAVTVQSKPVEDLGLLQGQNLMLIDLEKCTRCDQCVDACVEAHDDGATRLIREGPRFGKYLVPSSCRMCMDPVCMIGCPVGSIRRTPDLNIFIEDWCIGCGVCAKQCPYDSIQMHGLDELGVTTAHQTVQAGEVVAVTDRAVVCDQCSSLPTGPACVYSCPHDAALRVQAAEFLGATKLVSHGET